MTEVRGKQHEAQLEEKLKAEARALEEKRNFHAQPVNIEPVLGSANIAPKKATQVREFHLFTQMRGEVAKEKFEGLKNAILDEEQMAFSSFKARPNLVTDRPGFIAQKSEKPLTDPDEVVLASEARCAVRKPFDEEQMAKALEAAALEQQKKLADEKRVAEEIQQLRKSLIHQPLPIMKPNPIEIKPSTQPLTEPSSPMLLTKRRAELTNNQ